MPQATRGLWSRRGRWGLRSQTSVAGSNAHNLPLVACYVKVIIAVRWASKREQANNRSSTRFVTYEGEAKPSADAARAEGITPAAFRQRFYRKQSEVSAFQQMVEDFENGVGGDPRLFRWPRHRQGLSAEWEELWKRSGGLRRGNSRYDFFIRMLQDTQSQIQDDLNSLEDRDVPRTDQRWDVLSDDFGRTRKHLVRALNERPIWESIVRRHELRKRADKKERDALQSDSYLRPGEDDGE